MQIFASKKNTKMIKKEVSLFDGNDHGGQSMMKQETRAKELYEQLKTTSDLKQIQNIEKEIFEIEKYCHTVNILLCGGV